MSDAKELFESYREQAKKVLVLFHSDEKTAVEELEKLKAMLSEKETVSDEARELFEACRYNALATINSVPVQNRASVQLSEAVTDASSEIEAICELL